MIDLDTVAINIPCPKCGFANPVTIQDVRVQKRVVCRGCKRNIQLIDGDASTSKAKKDIGKSMRNLEKKIKDINMKIKL